VGIFNKLIDRSTGMRRRNDFFRRPVSVEMEDKATGNIRPYVMDSNEEFTLTAAVTVSYWANQAQRNDARRNAEHVLAGFLYRDVLAKLSEVRHAIFDGDANEALAKIGELEESLKP
jgi:hypothetical protein